MTARYYGAMVRSEDGQIMLPPTGPLESHAKVVALHAQQISLQSPTYPIQIPKYEPRVLLDTGSIVTTSEEDTGMLLHHDPILRALFELGRRYGQQDAQMFDHILHQPNPVTLTC